MELHCPRCLSKDVRKSRQSSVLAVMFRWFSMNPYRCRNCRKRFFRAGNCEALWDAIKPTPVLATFPVPAPVQPAYREPPAHAISSVAVRKRDWERLLAQNRIA
jgi:DNA-directed RNA polymerase subunit RPC12/RpoP